MGKIGDLWVKLGLNKSEFTAGLESAKKETFSFGKDVKDAISSVVTKTLALTAAFAAVGRAIAGAVKNIAQFQRANSELAAVLGTNLKGVERLSDSAKELGRTSEFTASEVTQLQIALARLGFNTGQIEAMQDSVLKFALAMGTDLGSAAEFTGSALRAFGLSASDTTSLLDVMSKSTTVSALNFSKLQTSIAVVAPIAKSFGLNVKETAAFLGVLANNGFDASSAATALRNILLNLADSNGKLAQGLGHSARTFPEIIKAFKELRDKGVDVNSILQMTDKRSAAAASALISMAGDVDTLKRSLDEADGSLNTMADTMADNLIGQVNSLKSAWEGLTLEFGNSTGPMSKVIGKLRDLLQLLRDYQHATSTGSATRRDITNTEDLRQRFRDVEKKFGTEEMQRQFVEWEKDAEAAYDRAIDNYLAHRSIKNKRAMNKAGRDVMALSDIRSDIMGYSPAYDTTPTETDDTTPTNNNGDFNIPDPDAQKKALKELKEAVKEAGEEARGVVDEYEEMLEIEKQNLAVFERIHELGPAPLFDNDTLLALEEGLRVATQIGDELNSQSLFTDLNKQLDEFIDKTIKARDAAENLEKEIAENLIGAIEDGLVGAFDELANVIGGVTEGGMENVAKALLEPLADMAIKAGTLIMMSGEAIQALKESFINFFGGSAVVAGAALVAVGIAAKAGLAALGNRGAGASAVSSYSSSGTGYAVGGVSTAELVVRVEGEVKGSSIILSGQNTMKEWNK